MARARFDGPLATLPARFKVGLEDYFSVSALRVSASVRPAEELARKLPLVVDAGTTWHGAASGEATFGKSGWQRDVLGAALFPDRAVARFVAEAGVPLTLPLRAVNFGGRATSFHVGIELRDRSGKPEGRAEASIEVAANSDYTSIPLNLPIVKAAGYHEAVLRIVDSASRVEEHRFGFVVRPAGEGTPGRLADYLGHHHPLGAKADALSQLGISWHRAWASERSFLWNVVEPAPGDFHWEGADRAVAAAESQGIKTLGLLGNPPTWASTYSAAEADRLKDKSVRAYTHNPDRYQPRSIDEWTRYVRAVAGRYRGRVSHWEIYNEVDFHPPFLHASFSGSTGDYAALLAAARQVIKEVDPAAQVLTSGFSLLKGVNDASMPADLMKLGAGENFDILAVHGYAERTTLAEVIDAVRAAKPGVPLWQTERQYMGGVRDDYQAIYSLFWCLERGFSHYFLHESDLDKNFGYLNPTPYYAVTSEVARQLRAADALIGPVPGAGEGLASWRLSRADGRFLQVFAANHGRFELTFSGLSENAPVEVTSLYGETLHSGPLDRAKLSVEGLVYVVSPAALEIAQSRRAAGNVVSNPGFEIREGDFIMDESAARPSYWVLRPKEVKTSAMRFVPGRSGAFAVELGGVSAPGGAHVAQALKLEEAGLWRLSAWVRVPRGATVPLRFFLHVGDGRWPGVRDARSVVGTGEWQLVTFEASAPAGGGRAYVLLGVESGAVPVAFDDVELMPVASAR